MHLSSNSQPFALTVKAGPEGGLFGDIFFAVPMALWIRRRMA